VPRYPPEVRVALQELQIGAAHTGHADPDSAFTPRLGRGDFPEGNRAWTVDDERFHC
jgi:hypothetical protein